MSRRNLRTVAIAMLALGGAACTTMVRQHPNLAQQGARMRTIAVVPPEAKVTLIAFTGDDQPLPEDERAIVERLPELIALQLDSRGLWVRQARSFEAGYAALPELRFQTTQLQTSFAVAATEMYQTLQMRTSLAESYRRSLGEQAGRVAAAVDADGLLVSRVEGFRKTSGQIASDFAKSLIFAALTGAVVIQPTQGAALVIALVDGTTGEVLWSNIAGAPGDPKTTLPAMVKQAFAPFPQLHPAGTVEASAPPPQDDRLSRFPAAAVAPVGGTGPSAAAYRPSGTTADGTPVLIPAN